MISSGLFENSRTVWESSIYDLILMIRGKNEAFEKQMQIDNIRFGSMMAAIYNTIPRRDKRKFQWTDFYKDRSMPKTMTDEEVITKIRSMFGGGNRAA